MGPRSGLLAACTLISKYTIAETSLVLLKALTSRRSFSTGCKTDDGFTVILIPRVEGVETKPIKTSYSSSAGTAYVTFDDVKVPVENTLGPEGGGIFVILS